MVELEYTLRLKRSAEGIAGSSPAAGTKGDTMSLYEATKDLHHACEKHPVGAKMSDGTIGKQWWSDWLGALLAAHEVIDPDIDERLWRKDQLKVDVLCSAVPPRENFQVNAFVEELGERPNLREAARYVLTGAHLMGGQVTRVRIGSRLPNAHLHFKDRKEVSEIWKPYRERNELSDDAREVFHWLLKIMDEIEGLG